MSDKVWLGVDFGSKWVGVAVSASGTTMTFPLDTIDAKPEIKLLEGLLKLAKSHSAVGFVVGLPINMNGSEGPAAKLCRDFAKRLGDFSEMPAELFDERLSSWDAEGMLIEGGMKPHDRKKQIHAVSAKVILDGFIQAQN
ncbi:MAG: Holliday junction resolvase RuvX [Planctomycetota bacterium]